MNVWHDLGIQQWRLRPGFAQNKTLRQPESEGETSDDVTFKQVLAPTSDADVLTGFESDKLHDSIVDSGLDTADDTAVSPDQVEPLNTLNWRGLQAQVEDQSLCHSCSKTNSLLGSGDQHADWVFIVDAPTSGDLQNHQFINGRAGQLFDAMLQALSLDRTQVYITSVFKCAPTDDLSITPSCSTVLRQQLALIQPNVVVTLGEFAAQAVIRANECLEDLRLAPQQCFSTNLKIVPTYSPAQVLDDPSLKAQVWADLKGAMAIATH